MSAFARFPSLCPSVLPHSFAHRRCAAICDARPSKNERLLDSLHGRYAMSALGSPSNPCFSSLFSTTEMQFSPRTYALTSNPYWRFLLLSDEHVCQDLSVVTACRLSLRVHDLCNSDYCDGSVLLPPNENPAFEKGTTTRSTSLHLPGGKPVLQATSTWGTPKYNELIVGNEHKLLSQIFAARKLCVSRSILSIHFGTCADIAPFFDCAEDVMMWARTYIFRTERRGFLYVKEIFSPHLSDFVGPITPPLALDSPSL